MEEDNKCAPTKKYNNGSCFTIEDLKKISIAYNLHLDKGKVKGKKAEGRDRARGSIGIARQVAASKARTNLLRGKFVN